MSAAGGWVTAVVGADVAIVAVSLGTTRTGAVAAGVVKNTSVRVIAR